MVKRVRTEQDREKDRIRYANRSFEDNERRKRGGKKYYNENREKVLKKCRENHLKKSYGLTSDDYFELVKKQDNKCAICNQKETRFTKTGDIKPLSVDHNHKTGEVRMLLCNDCNALLGFCKESPEILQSAKEYLEMFIQADLRNW